MFNNGQFAKLADFGLARNIDNELSRVTNNVGTFKFMAPEAQRGRHVPFKSDMYSLGLVLHFMLTKSFPDYYLHVKTS